MSENVKFCENVQKISNFELMSIPGILERSVEGVLLDSWCGKIFDITGKLEYCSLLFGTSNAPPP